MKKKSLLVMLLCSTFVWLETKGALFVYGQEPSSQNNEQNRQAAVANDLASLEIEIKDATAQITSLESKKESLNEDINTLYSEISDLNVRIQKRQVQMRNQARDVQTSSLGANYLDILINSGSISKALSRVQGIKTLIDANNQLLEKQIADKKHVEEKTKKVEAQMLILETSMNELENQKGALNRLKIQQEIVKNDLEAQNTTEEAEKEVYLLQKEAAQKKLEEEEQKNSAEKEKKKQLEMEEAVRLVEAQAANPGLLSTNIVGTDGVTRPGNIVSSEATTRNTSPTKSIGGLEKVSSAKQKAANRALNSIGQTNPTGWGESGECIVAVQNWLNASGIRFTPGGPHSGYVQSGAVQVSWSDVQVGDVVQYEHSFSPDSWLDGVHTVLVVGVREGTVQIVESNNPAGSGYVSSTTGWTPKPYVANFRATVWRFPG